MHGPGAVQIPVKIGIQILSPSINEVVSSPIHIKGVVSGNGWSGFEGQVGTVHLFDSDGKEIAVTYLPAITEWTQLPTNFETNLSFTASKKGMGTLIFYNENPSGEFERSKSFSLPVMFK